MDGDVEFFVNGNWVRGIVHVNCRCMPNHDVPFAELRYIPRKISGRLEVGRGNWMARTKARALMRRTAPLTVSIDRMCPN